MLDELRARLLLSECTGDNIWSLAYCRQQGVPAAWIDELLDGFESGFLYDKQTIYYGGEVVHQFEGVRDIDLAHKLAAYLGIDVPATVAMCISRSAEVRALKEAVEEQ